MPTFTVFLKVMCGLFVLSGVVLMAMTAAQIVRKRFQRAAIYFALMALADLVAAGFFYFSGLIS